MTKIDVVLADLDNPTHQRDVVALTAAYAEDPMGRGSPLPAEVLQRLIPALRAHPTTLIVLAYDGERAIGIATCFLGFSTFAARPLLNVHDIAVLPALRGRGVARALLQFVERTARERGCVKLTLEVQTENRRALGVYRAAGFAQDHQNEAAGGALFFTKPL